MAQQAKRDAKGRLLTIRIPSDEVETQGEGSWVEFRRRLKAKHLRVIAQMATLQDVSFQDDPGRVLDVIDRMGQMLAPFVVAWNWTDEEGEPLPQPMGNAEVFGELDFGELMWLIERMGEHVGGIKRKN